MWHQVFYNQDVGLTQLIIRAVGRHNLGKINPLFLPYRFPLKGAGPRSVTARVEPYLSGETREQAAKRLTGAGQILGSTGDLAGFLHDHPDEVEKWGEVDAISDDSRWEHPSGVVLVPSASASAVISADRPYRRFSLVEFRGQRVYLNHGVLVLGEPGT